MRFLCRGFLLLSALALIGPGALADDYSVAPIDSHPEDASADHTKLLARPGFQVTGPDGPLCSLWLVKSPTVKEGFSPTPSVKYPFTPGAFVGLLKVEKGADFTDFREQELAPGLYTLRYIQQPQDGNHIGTSDVADFLLALPAKEDSPAPKTDDLDAVVELSSEAAESTHPAIFALRPAEQSQPGEAKLVHDSADDFWMLETAVGAGKPLPLRLVVVGFALE